MRLPLFFLTASLLFAGTADAMPIRPADNSIETIMAAVREKHAPDDFTAYFDVKTEWKDGVLHLSGHSDSLEAIAELRAAVMNAHIPTNDTIELVPQRNDLREQIWAVVSAPETQALPDERWQYPLPVTAGTPVQRLLDLGDGTSLVRLPDSHIVKLAERDLRLSTETDLFIWNRRDKFEVTRPSTPLYEKADMKSTVLLTLPVGALLRIDVNRGDFFEVAMADGRRGFVSKADGRELFAFQTKEELARRESTVRFVKDMAADALALGKTHQAPETEKTTGIAFLNMLFRRHDLILPLDAGLLATAFPTIDHGPRGKHLKAGDLLLFKNDRGIETIAFATAPGRFVTTGHPDGRLGTNDARTLGRLLKALRPDYGFLNDPCLTSTRSNPFYQTPAVRLVPCRNRDKIDEIR